MSGKIFISYTRRDKKIVRQIYKELKSAGCSPWLDVEDILPGENWRRAINKAIEEADIFLAILSENSVDKRGVIQREIRLALDKMDELLPGDVFIIPLRIDDCEIPERLKHLQVLDWDDGNGKRKLLQAIQNECMEQEYGGLRNHCLPESNSYHVIGQTDEVYYDAGVRIAEIRDELRLTTSQFAEILMVPSQRDYEAMDSGKEEVPLSVLRRIHQVSGTTLEWLKHGKGEKYDVNKMSIHPDANLLERILSKNPQKLFLTLERRDYRVGIVSQLDKYLFKIVDFGMNLDFWNWVESFWAIREFYYFLYRLTKKPINVEGRILPCQDEKKLFNGEIHFFTALRNTKIRGFDLPYDLIDLDNHRASNRPHSKTYGKWIDRTHEYFRKYLEEA